MNMATATLKAKVGPGRSRAQDIDRYVGARMRERRIMLGLTQQQMAELIGVTYQQAHKYEKGVNRISAGRLYQTAQALGVDVGYFFGGLAGGGSGPEGEPRLTSQQRLLLELARSFTSMPSRRHQEALCGLARALANPDALVAAEGGAGDGSRGAAAAVPDGEGGREGLAAA
jgi:transcriptional regulator with XRE-family HTH domain